MLRADGVGLGSHFVNPWDPIRWLATLPSGAYGINGNDPVSDGELGSDTGRFTESSNGFIGYLSFLGMGRKGIDQPSHFFGLFFLIYSPSCCVYDSFYLEFS